MNKIQTALFNGEVVKINMSIDVFFKKANGIFYTASTNEEKTAWTLSNVNEDFFNNEENFRLTK